MALITKDSDGNIIKVLPKCCDNCGGSKNSTVMLSKKVDNDDNDFDDEKITEEEFQDVT